MPLLLLQVVNRALARLREMQEGHTFQMCESVVVPVLSLSFLLPPYIYKVLLHPYYKCSLSLWDKPKLRGQVRYLPPLSLLMPMYYAL